ncbi:hypothetical protein TNCT_511601 [Trichonephila clavata]|uniref:Uncharacterized protein n=1 Tax=Trichonephila clavata TaxID=2740835 RepID=A0A8X6GV05_TRICU|nr:hypothetical protein TNCT_511601 [Trichonephila clavata]
MDEERFFKELALFVNSPKVSKLLEEYELEKKSIPYAPKTSPVTPVRLENRAYQVINNDPVRNLQMLFDIRDEQRRNNNP